MLKLQKHHKLILVFCFVFALAWAIWTFFMLPASEMPSNPDPATAPPVQIQ